MKRFLIFAVVAILCINVSSAQNKFKASEDFAKSIKGTWGLGFQTTFLNRSDVKWQNGLYAKYFVADKWALRTNLRFGRDYAKGIEPKYVTSTEYPDAGSNDADMSEEETPSTIIRKSNFMLILGAEHRQKLSNRFFGYYGVDLGIGGYGQIRKEFDNSGKLVDTYKQNRCCDMTIQPFLGLEFFVGRQISLGLEAGYDVLFKFYRKGMHVYENNMHSEQEDFVNQYTSIASHVDFGNCVFGTAKVAFYF